MMRTLLLVLLLAELAFAVSPSAGAVQACVALYSPAGNALDCTAPVGPPSPIPICRGVSEPVGPYTIFGFACEA